MKQRTAASIVKLYNDSAKLLLEACRNRRDLLEEIKDLQDDRGLPVKIGKDYWDRKTSILTFPVVVITFDSAGPFANAGGGWSWSTNRYRDWDDPTLPVREFVGANLISKAPSVTRRLVWAARIAEIQQHADLCQRWMDLDLRLKSIRKRGRIILAYLERLVFTSLPLREIYPNVPGQIVRVYIGDSLFTVQQGVLLAGDVGPTIRLTGEEEAPPKNRGSLGDYVRDRKRDRNRKGEARWLRRSK